MPQRPRKPQVTFEQKAIIFGMLKAGMKPTKISQQTGIGQMTVSAIVVCLLIGLLQGSLDLANSPRLARLTSTCLEGLSRKTLT
jgi:hypothetical protein